MPTITAKVSDELLAYIDLVSGGNRSEYLRRCLEAGPGDLESGLKIVTNQLSDVNRKLDYLLTVLQMRILAHCAMSWVMTPTY